MDFLDPKKRRSHAIRLWIGYVLIGVAILLATIVLLYQAYGFRITRQGEIIQNGLVFISSQPSDAAIFTNGERLGPTTNARLSLAAGKYIFELKREGYRDWKRGITVEGGSVQRFLYPFLFPVDLRTASVKTFESPGLSTQSPDRRWWLVQTNPDNFEMYDLREEMPVATELTMPGTIYAPDTTTVGWEMVEWGDGSRRVVLKRFFEPANGGERRSELILFDRERPAESRNLSTLLGFNPDSFSLRDGAYDQYYAFDRERGTIFTATLSNPTPEPYLRNVLDFKDDDRDTVLYATNDGAPEGKTVIRLHQGDRSYNLREIPRGQTPILNLSRHSGDWIVAAGTREEGRVSVYRNPLSAIRDGRVAGPVHVLKVSDPEQISFSANARFLVIKNNADFAVYDAEIERGYAYQIDLKDNATTSKVTWMDGHRITVAAADELLVFDFDGTNQHTLLPVKPTHAPAFNPAFNAFYAISPQNELQRANLIVEN